MKNLLYILLFLVPPQFVVAQCGENGNYWNESWVSCTTSQNPNSIRGNTHWILYDFDETQFIDSLHVWNANRIGESGWGAKEVVIDYSPDGIEWIEMNQFTFPKANESDDYEGFGGATLEGLEVKKLLLSILSTHDGGDCASIAEIEIHVNQDACFGVVDECGVCDGPGPTVWYLDADNDGLGDASMTIIDCEQPSGYVDDNSDLCDNGALGWLDIKPLFSDNGCNSCHGNGAAGGIDLRNYDTVLAGGNTCGTSLLTGTTFVDVIATSAYDGCGPSFGPSMNARASGEFDADELARLQLWINGGAPEECTDFTFTTDTDGDGFNSDEDCDDTDASINPDAIEIANNDIDEDCDGEALIIDEDGDGFNSDEDCDDNNAAVNPEAMEIANNEIDEDCDGEALIIDEDGDGFNSDEDCNDNDADVNPDATEIANNFVDEDCDGIALIIDEDGDGYNSDDDCDDNNADINPGATEILNNGIDEDCDGEDQTTATHEVENIGVRIFPNPARDEVYIETTSAWYYQVRLFDGQGQLVTKGINLNSIDLTSFAAGLYVIELINPESEARIVERLVVMK